MQKRPPVVTIMGHVDHGKTSLLDAIRNTNVASKEFGGITQHVSAYQISYKNRQITFVDTPGHEAFTNMRARGGSVADIVVLVVAGNEGVKPQTVEAISHAKASLASIIVAINKIDLPGVILEKVKKELAKEGIMVEGYGGDIVAVPVSAKEKKNIDELLDSILLLWDMAEEKKTNENFSAVVIESFLDKKKGPLASAVVRSGTLKVGDLIYAGNIECKVKALIGFDKKQVSLAETSCPVEILGFKEVPPVGSVLLHQKLNLEDQQISQTGSVQDETGKKVLGVVIKADTQGTLEALMNGVSKLKSEEAVLNILHKGVGDVTQGDVLLASTSGGIIMGFNVNYPAEVEFFATGKRIIVRTYKIIYELLQDLEGALQGIVELEEEKIKGRAKIVALFNLPSGDVICGANVFAGRFKVGDKVAIWDSEENLKEFLKDPKKSLLRPLFETKIKKIKLEKDSVEATQMGKNYGFLFDPQYKTPSTGYILHKH